ncbi:MAG TPA: iron chelate uptake ABC transporter family permease subunit, partial [Solirubrobacteraceae bacterium]|nr:iron chelate uptake ABC transporter family permease subunit [Solirubrobacteraceae bacterium]
MGGLIDLLPLDYTDAVVVLGSAIIGLTAGVLGCFAVLRQRSLVGDALSHAALPGVAVAFLITGAKDAGTLLIGAGIAGLIGALMMVGIERTSRIRPDAAIGVVLSCFFSLGIVLLTYIANGDDANQAGLDTYLFGQAASLLERDLTVMALLAVAALVVVALSFRALKTTLFDPSFARSAGLPVKLLEILMTALLVVAVVVGIRAVGAILMVALIVVPGVAARQFADRLSLMLPLAGAIGAGVGVTGGLISTGAAVPTGPVVVLVGVSVVIVSVLVAPERGVLWRARKLTDARRRRTLEALLLDLARMPEAQTVALLAAQTGREERDVARAVRELAGRGDVATAADDRLTLTAHGRDAAASALE